MRKQSRSEISKASRRYSLSKKRADNAYKNYVKRYRAKQKSLNKRGLEMESRKMTKREYLAVREDMVTTYGVTQNINQTIVSDQAYEYDREIARRLREAAEEYDLSWKGTKIRDLRQGKGIDLSELNERLKLEIGDAGFGKIRAKKISHDVFGSL